MRLVWVLGGAAAMACVLIASCTGEDAVLGDRSGTDGGGVDGSSGGPNDGAPPSDAPTDGFVDPTPPAKGDVKSLVDLADPLLATAVAVDKSDALVVVGTMRGAFTYKGTTFTPSLGKTEGFVARIDGTGAMSAFVMITTATPNPTYVTGNVTPQAVAVAEDGEVYVSGTMNGSTMSASGGNTQFVNPGATSTPPQTVGFVLRSRAADLTGAWATMIAPLGSVSGDLARTGCPAIAARVLPVGGQNVTRVIAGCQVTGTVTMKSEATGSPTSFAGFGGQDAALFSLAPSSGNLLWGSVLGGTLVDSVDSLAIGDDGDVRAGLRYTSPTLTNTGGDVNETNTTIGLQGLVVSAASATGAKKWTRVFRATANPPGNYVPMQSVFVGVDAKGTTTAAGTFAQTDVNFGKSNQSPGSGSGSIYIVKLDATGTDVQETFLPLAGRLVAVTVAFDPFGSTIFGSGYENSFAAPGLPTLTQPAKSELAPLVVKFDAKGTPKWVKKFDTTYNGDDVVFMVGAAGVNASGTIGYAGTLNGTWVVDGKNINPTVPTTVDAGRGIDNSTYFGFAIRFSP